MSLDIKTQLSLGLGKTIRAIREREGLTQAQLAEKSDIASRSIRAYESGDVEAMGSQGFTVSMFSKLCTALEIDPATLFSEILAHSGLPQGDTTLEDYLARMPAFDRSSLKTAIGRDEEPVGDVVAWALSLGAKAARLTPRSKAEAEQKVLELLERDKLEEMSNLENRLTTLYQFIIRTKK